MLAADFDFRNVDSVFTSMGIYEVVLPFLLCFTIVFAFLEKTKILGTNNKQAKKFNIVIAIVMGLLLVRVQTLVEMINGALPKVSVVIVAIVMMLIMIAMFKGDDPSGLFGPIFLQVVLWSSAVFVIWAFWSSYSGAAFPEWLSWIPDNLATIIVLGVFALILILITKGDTPRSSGNGQDNAAAQAAANASAQQQLQRQQGG